MTATLRCVGTPNGWGGNTTWPAPPSGLLRQPCGWEGTPDQANHGGTACPGCGGKAEPAEEPPT